MSQLARLERGAARYVPEGLFALLPPPSTPLSAKRLQKAIKTPLAQAGSEPSLRKRSAVEHPVLPQRAVMEAPVSAERVAADRLPNLTSHDLLRKLAMLDKSIARGYDTVHYSPALKRAHEILDTAYLAQPCSSTAAIRFRQDLYANVMSRFQNTAFEGTAIRSLLTRQIEDDIPLSTAVIKQVFHHILISPTIKQAGADRTGLVHLVLPLLPPQIDLELFTMLMTTLVQTVNPAPSYLRGIIADCLTTLGIEREQDWPLPLWDVLMQSHAHRLDLRGAVRELGRFRLVLAAKRLEFTLANVETGWTPDETKHICAPFVTLLRLWSNESLAFDKVARQPSRIGSKMPETIVSGLLQILGADKSAANSASQGCRQVHLPASLFAAWMNAERIAGHTDTVFEIWRLVSKGQGWQPPQPAAVPKHTASETTQLLSQVSTKGIKVDESHFIALLKTFRYTVPAQSPPRRLLGDLRTILAQSTSDIQIQIGAYDSLLSSVLASTEPDLPLVLVIIDDIIMASTGGDDPALQTVEPSARTADVLAAALLRLYRTGLPIFQASDNPYAEGPTLAKWQARLAAETGWHSLAMWEWDTITRAVDRIRSAQPRDRAIPANIHKRLAARGRVELPMRKVLARLDPATDTGSRPDRQETHTWSGNASVETKTAIALRRAELRSVLLALKQLYERAIVLQARLDSAWEELSDEQVVREVREQAHHEAFPCQT